jgi:protein TonB
MAYVDTKTRSQKLPSIAGVVAVHALIGYAFISGLAYEFVKQVTPVFTVTSIPEDTIPPAIEKLPPPQVEKVAPEQVTTVPRVIEDFRPAQDGFVVVPIDRTVTTVEEPVRTVLPQPPQVSKAAGVRVAGNRAAWITTDDYPSAAIRAEQEGVVTISVRVGADGRVGACMVTGSSGHAALDEATCRLYQRRARFSPALDDAGTAVASTYVDRVRWELPRQ